MKKNNSNPSIGGRKKLDVDQFREGSAESELIKSQNNINNNYDATRQSKTIRISKTHALLISENSYKRSLETGKKVNEADILEEALNKYFGIN